MSGNVLPEPHWADRDDLRTSFTLALSTMYRSEVPLYGDLVRIVDTVNSSELAESLDSKVLAMRFGDVDASRLDLERHGAIRLGTPQELHTVRRVFEVIGLYPVGYYDLSKAGLPMHATCFRPITEASLHKNPFRVFTSVLRPELLRDGEARDIATRLLSTRQIFSDGLLRLLDLSDRQNKNLTPEQGQQFIAEALKTFAWRRMTFATKKEYEHLKSEHPVLADIACFQTAHINHLTPRTLDIAASQEMMEKNGLEVKDRIEGPPPRTCPILLRQTSFLAIQESITHASKGDYAEASPHSGTHKARFGEIEERGAAVTKAGRRLYDQLFDEILRYEARQAKPLSQDAYYKVVDRVFQRYPDDWHDLRRQGLLYYTFRCTDKTKYRPNLSGAVDLESLLNDGLVEAFPITYEDFLPLSAAGIFQSNLDSQSLPHDTSEPDYDGLQAALGVPIYDPDHLYQLLQDESLGQCSSILGVRINNS